MKELAIVYGLRAGFQVQPTSKMKRAVSSSLNSWITAWLVSASLFAIFWDEESSGDATCHGQTLVGVFPIERERETEAERETEKRASEREGEAKERL